MDSKPLECSAPWVSLFTGDPGYNSFWEQRDSRVAEALGHAGSVWPLKRPKIKKLRSAGQDARPNQPSPTAWTPGRPGHPSRQSFPVTTHHCCENPSCPQDSTGEDNCGPALVSPGHRPTLAGFTLHPSAVINHNRITAFLSSVSLSVNHCTGGRFRAPPHTRTHKSNREIMIGHELTTFRMRKTILSLLNIWHIITYKYVDYVKYMLYFT